MQLLIFPYVEAIESERAGTSIGAVYVDEMRAGGFGGGCNRGGRRGDGGGF
jgi:hypothetical protein